MSNTFSFGSAFPYSAAGTGCAYPSIALNNNYYFIEVHIKGSGTNNLYYMLGQTDGPSYVINKGPTAFDTGNYPSVGMASADPDNFIIIVFTDSSGHLYSRSGKVDFANNTITWNNSGRSAQLSNAGNIITTAFHASAAVNTTGNIVIVYQDTSNYLWYKTGYTNSDHTSIEWADAVQYSTGEAPKIALNFGNSFVEVHGSKSFSSLYYTVGTVATGTNNSGNTITTLSFLSQDVEYLGESLGTPSNFPGVGINESGMVVEVHMPAEAGNLWFQTGYMDAGTIHFNPSVRYLDSDVFHDATTGMYPATALNDNGTGIQVYQSNAGTLYFSLSVFANRAVWMQDFGAKKLSELCLPGSHDAGMSQATLCDTGASYGNTVTQVQNIGLQLTAGIRYFDIRPVFNSDDEIYTGHYSSILGDIAGCYGQYMPDILSEVNSFISANPSEVVILKFSHFLDKSGIMNHFFSSWVEGAGSKQPLINGLINQIAQYINSSHLYVHTGNTRITENTLNTITANKTSGKVIILFDIKDLDGVTLNNNPDTNNIHFVNTYLDLVTGVTKSSADWVMYDTYSNTNDMAIMTSSTNSDGQLYMIKQTANHAGDFYLCSWTLTLNPVEAENPGAYAILELAQLANGVLANDMMTNVRSGYINASAFPNIIYVDAADCPATDICEWVNQQNLK